MIQLTTPKKVSIIALGLAAFSALSGWAGGAYALGSRDARQEQATKEAIEQVAQVRTDVDSIKKEIGRLRDDFSKMQQTDAVQTAMTQETKATMTRVEEKVDNLLLMLSRKP
jgi:uncharacterized coiled-coil protein SlyX